jgi:hypothetical protein
MEPTTEATSEESGPPLRVEHRRALTDPPRFVPESLLLVTPALKDCGLLAALGDREARTLLAVLSLLTPDGRFEASAPAVARVLGTGDHSTVERLRELAKVRWRDAPVVVEVPREQALPVWVPSPAVVSRVSAPPEPSDGASPGSGASEPPGSPSPSRREQVYGFSRARYARGRAEVEAQVLRLMGKDPASLAEAEAEETKNDPPDGTPEGEAFRTLLAYGVERPKALSLVARFGPERVLRQAGWMGRRAARTPSRFLVSAIEHDFDPPRNP